MEQRGGILPIQLGGLGSIVSSSSGVRAGATPDDFLVKVHVKMMRLLLTVFKISP